MTKYLSGWMDVATKTVAPALSVERQFYFSTLNFPIAHQFPQGRVSVLIILSNALLFLM